MSHKIVAHFSDHSVVKGTSLDVDPGRPTCHVHTPEQGVVEVDLTQLKAVFFVKDFGGRPDYRERHEPATGDSRLRGSRQVFVTFHDGERLGGLMTRFPPNRPFFYMLPMDPESNNIRVLVNREAVTALEAAPEAPAAAAPAADPAAPNIRKRTTWVFDGKDIKFIDAEPRKKPEGR
ncbi:MAG TPA: hypothetical protein VJ992_03230 [Gemmatimonadales bacterium]|nr:hypothetical protein [Gemmatimonadales bacterium]